MSKLNRFIATSAAALMLCVAVNSAFYIKISARFDEVQQKQVETDGRRNAQYGIIKRKLEQCGVSDG